MSIVLNDQQEDAIKKFKHWWNNERHIRPIFYLYGYGGTGKSTLLPMLLECTGLDLETTKFPEVACMAPTAKAALVMRNKLHTDGLSTTLPKTIHHYLYVPIDDDLEDDLNALESESDPILKARLQYEITRRLATRKVSFLSGTSARLVDCQLIVVDEASMVGSKVGADLLNLGIPILAMGDPGQLPPVNDTAALMVDNPDVFLTDIRRQAKDNPIILFASLLREGKDVPNGEYDGKLFVYSASEADDKVDVTDGRQIILGTHRRRWALTRGIRKILHGVDAGAPPLKGEPIIIKRNHRKFPHIINGSLGRMEETLEEWNLHRASGVIDATIEGVPFHGEVYCGLFQEHIHGVAGYCEAGPRATRDAQIRTVHADWAYAITCHAAQGSQFDEPIVFDESQVFRSDKNRWAYTAASRAADKLVWIRT